MIHPKAHVEGATIGEGTRVWQFASVIRKARLGKNCNVGSCATVDGAWLGDNCIVCPGAFVVPGTLVGDNVFIGPNVTICNDRWPATNRDDFYYDLLVGEFVSVHIKDGASIGANCVILPGVTIGRNAVIAAGTRVDKSVPDDMLYSAGNFAYIKPSWRRRRMREAS